VRLGGDLVRGRLPGLGDDLGQLDWIVVIVPLVLEFERLVVLAPLPGRQPRLPGFVATCWPGAFGCGAILSAAAPYWGS